MTSVSLSSPLISFTPLIQTPDHNLVRISRTHNLPDEIHLVAGGQHKGIIINRIAHNQQFEELQNCLPWNFSVWLGNGKQEIRSFQFSFYDWVSPSEQSAISQRFIKDLFSSFPKDYANFFKMCLKLMQKPDFQPLEAIDVEMKFAQASEAIPMPDVKEYANDAEIENVTIGHIQDVLEHAYPNGLSVDMIAESLRCPQEEIDAYLEELEKAGIAQRVPNQPNEWIRVDNFSIPESQHQAQSKHHPTVAIITCLFVEKQSIDAIIEKSSTLHKYSKAGDSNVYTIGYIGEHRVVATKLAMIGDSREATTSAGSITTRLLGSFQHVEHVIIVGVGGGVPHYTDPNLHVRLGDVVVSHGVRQADKKTNAYVYAHNFVMNRKTEQVEGFATHEWSPKDNVLADIVLNRDKSLEDEWHQTADRLMNELNETVKGNEYDFCKPPTESDVLTVQIGPENVVVFPHPNPKHSQPNLHCGPIGAMVSVRKPQAPAASDSKGPSRKENTPPSPPPKSKTNGPMAGEATVVDPAVEDANWLNMNNQLKDKFAADNQLKAFDAGFDSVIAAINGSRIDSWVLVRGLADYQQGSTRLGRQWQNAFTEEHKRLYNEAKKVSNDYGKVTTHYYSVMAKVIDEYFNGNFHFVPPPKCTDKSSRRQQNVKMTLEEALNGLHQRIGQCLKLKRGKHCLDIGCGIGGVIEDLANTQATFTGLTISPNEVEMGNENFNQKSISSTCRIVQANCLQGIPLETASQDAAYAIYSLKYFPELRPIVEEVARVLKPGGLFLVYDLVKTSKYDKSNEEHKKLLGGLEFACGMPCLHSRQDLIDSMCDFELVESVDLSAESDHPFYYCFNSSAFFMWLVRSPIVKLLVKIGQFSRVLPKGFYSFNKIFLSGTVDKIVRAGELGILSGAEILLFQKKIEKQDRNKN